MSLSQTQFERAADLAEHQERLARLSRMSSGQLRALFSADASETAHWVRSAAESGIAAAQLTLGRLLLEGRGLARDERAAFSWFARAAGQGDAEAMNMLGRCHELGWGSTIDLAQAAHWYRASALRGHDWGQYNLANLLFDGRGVPQELGAAFSWYLTAANQGHARAMNLLGRCLEEGWGCRRSPQEAIEWYRRGAEAGYFRAQYNYALELLGQGEAELAASWLWRAAHDGDGNIRSAISTLLSRLNVSAWNAAGLSPFGF